MAAVDTACWDLFAKRQGLSLGVAMGGQPRSIPVYGSGGFNAQQLPEEAADAALAHVARGFSAVKPRVSGQPSDAKLLSAVRDAVGATVQIMADANEKCDLASAQWLTNVARDLGLLFVEEPFPVNALNAYRALKATAPVAIATEASRRRSIWRESPSCSA